MNGVYVPVRVDAHAHICVYGRTCAMWTSVASGGGIVHHVNLSLGSVGSWHPLRVVDMPIQVVGMHLACAFSVGGNGKLLISPGVPVFG